MTVVVPTTVINLTRGHAFDLSRLVKVIRPTKWGNPFTHYRYSQMPRGVREYVDSREAAIAKHREWILQQPELMRAIVPELKGNVLGCVCVPAACHAQTLAIIADTYPNVQFPDGTFVIFDQDGYCTGGGIAIPYKREQ